MLKPKRLKRGSKIAIISPSAGLPSVFPDIYELGLKNLKEKLGFEIIEMPTARMSMNDLYENPELRAEDINACFRNDEIEGMITTIGGDDSVRILPYLDTELMRNNPKFIRGFSDATTFLAYFNHLGLVTFYGPSVMAGIAQMDSLPNRYTEHLQTFLFSNVYPYSYHTYHQYTNGYEDWGKMETLGQCKEFHHNTAGWNFLQGESVVKGQLWGGNIEVLEFIKSTRFWVEDSFWQGKVLFFETSEEKPTPRSVGYMLRNYGTQGAFSKAAGIIFGRAKDYSQKEKEELNETIIQVVRNEFGATSIPIVTEFDVGHTDPKLILPLGGIIEINPVTKEVSLLESPFENE